MKKGVVLLLFTLVAGTATGQVTVSVPSVQASVGEVVEIPVRLDDVENGTLIQAFEFVLSPSNANLQLRGARFDGTLVGQSGWTVSCNTAISKCLGFSGPSQALRTSGILVYLQYAVVSAGSNTEVRLTNFRLNGGSPSHQPEVPAFTVSITSDGEQNSPPFPPVLNGPGLTMVGGYPEDDNVTLSWNAVNDPDGDDITYSLLIGLDQQVSDPLIQFMVGYATELTLNVRQMGGIMSAALTRMGQGVAVGQSVVLYAQLIAFDGQSSSSSNVLLITAIRAEIVGIEYDHPRMAGRVSAFPNPAQSQIAIEWQADTATSSTIMVADALGTVVYSGVPDSSESTSATSASLDISAWADGVYVYRVLLNGPMGKQVLQGRFIKNDE